LTQPSVLLLTHSLSLLFFLATLEILNTKDKVVGRLSVSVCATQAFQALNRPAPATPQPPQPPPATHQAVEATGAAAAAVAAAAAAAAATAAAAAAAAAKAKAAEAEKAAAAEASKMAAKRAEKRGAKGGAMEAEKVETAAVHAAAVEAVPPLVQEEEVKEEEERVGRGPSLRGRAAERAVELVPPEVTLDSLLSGSGPPSPELGLDARHLETDFEKKGRLGTEY